MTNRGLFYPAGHLRRLFFNDRDERRPVLVFLIALISSASVRVSAVEYQDTRSGNGHCITPKLLRSG